MWPPNELPEAVILDAGGVVVTFRHGPQQRRWERRLGLPPGMLHAAVRRSAEWGPLWKGELTAGDPWADACDALAIPHEERAEFRAAHFEGEDVNDQLMDVVRRIRVHCPVGLLSNAPAASREQTFSRLKLLDEFDHIILSSDVGCLKPDRRIYQYACTAFGASPERCLFVDDKPINVEGARRAGMRAFIHVDTRLTCRLLARSVLPRSGQGSGEA